MTEDVMIKKIVNARDFPVIALRLEPVAYALVCEAAEKDQRKVLDWCRLAVEREAKRQLGFES